MRCDQLSELIQLAKQGDATKTPWAVSMARVFLHSGVIRAEAQEQFDKITISRMQPPHMFFYLLIILFYFYKSNYRAKMRYLCYMLMWMRGLGLCLCAYSYCPNLAGTLAVRSLGFGVWLRVRGFRLQLHKVGRSSLSTLVLNH